MASPHKSPAQTHRLNISFDKEVELTADKRRRRESTTSSSSLPRYVEPSKEAQKRTDGESTSSANFISTRLLSDILQSSSSSTETTRNQDHSTSLQQQLPTRGGIEEEEEEVLYRPSELTKTTEIRTVVVVPPRHSAVNVSLDLLEEEAVAERKEKQEQEERERLVEAEQKRRRQPTAYDRALNKLSHGIQSEAQKRSSSTLREKKSQLELRNTLREKYTFKNGPRIPGDHSTYSTTATNDGDNEHDGSRGTTTVASSLIQSSETRNRREGRVENATRSGSRSGSRASSCGRNTPPLASSSTSHHQQNFSISRNSDGSIYTTTLRKNGSAGRSSPTAARRVGNSGNSTTVLPRDSPARLGVSQTRGGGRSQSPQPHLGSSSAINFSRNSSASSGGSHHHRRSRSASELDSFLHTTKQRRDALLRKHGLEVPIVGDVSDHPILQRSRSEAKSLRQRSSSSSSRTGREPLDHKVTARQRRTHSAGEARDVSRSPSIASNTSSLGSRRSIRAYVKEVSDQARESRERRRGESPNISDQKKRRLQPQEEEAYEKDSYGSSGVDTLLSSPPVQDLHFYPTPLPSSSEGPSAIAHDQNYHDHNRDYSRNCKPPLSTNISAITRGTSNQHSSRHRDNYSQDANTTNDQHHHTTTSAAVSSSDQLYLRDSSESRSRLERSLSKLSKLSQPIQPGTSSTVSRQERSVGGRKSKSMMMMSETERRDEEERGGQSSSSTTFPQVSANTTNQLQKNEPHVHSAVIMRPVSGPAHRAEGVDGRGDFVVAEEFYRKRVKASTFHIWTQSYLAKLLYNRHRQNHKFSLFRHWLLRARETPILRIEVRALRLRPVFGRWRATLRERREAYHATREFQLLKLHRVFSNWRERMKDRVYRRRMSELRVPSSSSPTPSAPAYSTWTGSGAAPNHEAKTLVPSSPQSPPPDSASQLRRSGNLAISSSSCVVSTLLASNLALRKGLEPKCANSLEHSASELKHLELLNRIRQAQDKRHGGRNNNNNSHKIAEVTA